MKTSCVHVIEFRVKSLQSGLETHNPTATLVNADITEMDKEYIQYVQIIL